MAEDRKPRSTPEEIDKARIGLLGKRVVAIKTQRSLAAITINSSTEVLKGIAEDYHDVKVAFHIVCRYLGVVVNAFPDPPEQSDD